MPNGNTDCFQFYHHSVIFVLKIELRPFGASPVHHTLLIILMKGPTQIVLGPPPLERIAPTLKLYIFGYSIWIKFFKKGSINPSAIFFNCVIFFTLNNLVDIVNLSHNHGDSLIHSSAEPIHFSFPLAYPLNYSNAGWVIGLSLVAHPLALSH